MNIKFIIQARSGSSRLPDKMNLPFYQGATILQIIVERLKINFPHIPIVIATTTNSSDDRIEKLMNEMDVYVYRGSEENVLERFLEAGIKSNAEHVIRVCADNPFISVKYLEKLIDFYKEAKADYVSYISSNGLPAMKTHYGFFLEIMSLNALKLANESTDDKFYLEHVTNYIYGNPNQFSTRFLEIPFEIEEADMRLTVDTIADFTMSQKIYDYLIENELAIEPKEIIDYLNNKPDFLQEMKNQINLNKK